jgi:hypothetical protein
MKKKNLCATHANGGTVHQVTQVMDHVWGLVLQSNYLEWDDLEKLSQVTPVVREVHGDHLALYARIKYLAAFVKAFVSTERTDHDCLWWDSTRAAVEYAEHMWPPLDTPLLLAVYYAMLMRAFPCSLGRVEDNKTSWSCFVHPDTLTLKQLPEVDGKLYFRSDAIRDSVQLIFNTHFFTHETHAFIMKSFRPCGDVDAETLIDCGMLQRLLAARVNLFDPIAVMRIVVTR